MANRIFDEATLLQAAAILQQQQFQQQQHQQNLYAQATLLAMQQSGTSDSWVRSSLHILCHDRQAASMASTLVLCCGDFLPVCMRQRACTMLIPHCDLLS